MHLGNFFSVDTSSDFTNGIIYFRYIPVCRKREQRKGSDSDYPIYLTITASSIIFFIQERRNPDTRNQELIYSHTELFHLPLSTNLRSRDNLRNIIRELFNKPVTQLEHDFYSCRYTEVKDDGTVKCKRPNFDKVPGTYANLKLPENGSNKVSESYNHNEKYAVTYRELILDFLFDLEHSQVFKNSPHYEKMEQSLREDLFFSALAAKYDFYYKRKILRVELDTGKLDKANVIKTLYDDYYVAHNQWLDILCLPQMVRIINEKNNWFEEIEKEQKNVLFPNDDPVKQIRKNNLCYSVKSDYKESSLKSVFNPEDFQDNLQNSTKWFLRRYDFFSSIRIALQEGKIRTILNFLFIFLITYFAVKLLTAYNNIPKVDSIDHVYNISIYLKYFRILFSIQYLDLFLFPLTLIITIVLIVRRSWRRNKILTIGLFMPRTLMAATSAWLILASSDEGWRTHFDMNIKLALLVGFILSVVIFLFMMVEVKNITSGKAGSLFRRVLIVFIVGLAYSLVIGTLYTSFTARTILTRSGIAQEYFTGNTFKNENIQTEEFSPETDYFKKFISAEPPNFKKNNAGCNVMYEYKIPVFNTFLYIFPGMLIINSCLALFIGIFLQLIFEDKPVTEPL